MKIACRQGRTLLPEELLDDFERHFAAQEFNAPGVAYDARAEEVFRQVNVLRAFIEDTAYIPLVKMQHLASQAEHDRRFQNLPYFRHDGFGKLQLAGVLPPDDDQRAREVEIVAIVEGQGFAETQRAVTDEQEDQP